MENPNGTLSRIESKESVEMEIRDCHDAVRSYFFRNVLFVPSYSLNLMSGSSAVASGLSFTSTRASDSSFTSTGIRWGQLPVKQRGKLFFPECKFKRNPMTQ